MAASVGDAAAAAGAEAQAAEVEVTVLTLAGEPLVVVSLPSSSTVLDLKQAIATRCGHLVEVQQLTYKESALNDSKQTLTECGLEGNVAVTLLVRGIDVDLHIERLRAKGSLTEAEDIKLLCAMAEKIFLKEPSLLQLEPPLVISGNLVGCADQLHHIFDTFGDPAASQHLFLGNYVNRGHRAVETLTLLLLYKKKYPERIHLLRGKFETLSLSRIYGFYDECKKKELSVRIWKEFVRVFNSMPICALVQERILCVPSGLSPFLQSLDDLRKIHRPTDIPDHGLLCDLLFAYYDDHVRGWEDGDKSIEMCFGLDVVEEFLTKNGLEKMCCSPRVLEEGKEARLGDRLLQVFTASNYCGEFDNRGAVLLLDEHLEHKFVTHDLPWQERGR
ncbi:TOPP3 [Symbiodinium natans]|uniref:protein-serine/threonine phosphatase n=1 Tax=Symbiodinium natans TaxID=878477 RepID=A0A812N6U5_9DINO|nr:TOPP3 [Symbiodinium natans]